MVHSLGTEACGRGQCFQLGGKLEAAFVRPVVQGLLPGPVASEKQRGRRARITGVVQCEREHAIQLLHALCSPAGVGRQDDFCVGMADENRTIMLKFTP